MSTFQTGGYGRPVQWPAGPRISGIGTRLGAWLLDSLLFGLISAGLGFVAVAAGVVAANPEATRQLADNPNAQPTVPLYTLSDPGLALFGILWVSVSVAYPALCWAFAGALPGQRILGLRVADASTGRNLSPARATARSAVLNGIIAVSLAAIVAAALQIMASEPPAAYQGSSDQLSRTVLASDWSVVISIASLAVWVWPLALLLSTAGSFDHRGIHDSAGGSLVVRMAAAPAWSPYGSGYVPSTPYGPAPQVPGPGAALGTTPPPPPPGTPGGPPFAPPAGPSRLPSPPDPGSVWSPSGEPEPIAGRLGGSLRMAPFGRRTAAYAMDMVLIFVLYSFVGLVVLGPAGGSDAASVADRDLMLVGLVTGVAQFVYFIASWSAWRGSLGQRALGLLVVQENGDRIGPMDAIARWAAMQGPIALSMAVPSGWVIFVSLAAAAWTAVLLTTVRSDPQGRGAHDRIAGSRVILAS